MVDEGGVASCGTRVESCDAAGARLGVVVDVASIEEELGGMEHTWWIRPRSQRCAAPRRILVRGDAGDDGGEFDASSRWREGAGHGGVRVLRQLV
uniref:Uncharacterized protein n=1 Tax=Arundo donax TaxID=35708 RepID=A0A0A9GCV0_ARUDO